MAYSLIKNIKTKKKAGGQRLLDVFILIIAIPVTLIAAICLLIYFAFLWVRSWWSTDRETADETYHVELELVKNTWITLLLVEDEHDALLSQLNEDWNREVYREQTCLYRLKATPAIPALENKVCCFYYKEQPEGIIIQLVDDSEYALSGRLNSRLVLIQYPDLTPCDIDEAGPFFLFNDEADPEVICGFNEKEKIRLNLVKR